MAESGLRVVMLGAPGCGKGTQADLLAEVLRVPAISTGAMLREAVEKGTKLGERVKAIMAAGALVDDALMAEVVAQRLGLEDAVRGFLLDGYPRTDGQAETLDRLLADRGKVLDAAIYLEVPEAVLVRRALGRQREDDREDVVRERLRVYREKTEPLVARFERRGLLRRIDGDRPMSEVTTSILRALGRGGQSWS